ncbi:methylamine utilization protein MauJ [uncultured Albimonas sp.]|uniref:methylamine utilization protein MauJ n=1 Tax=uncultured Albimonas sp. TaxID=1331701 RepID=UPI0030EEFB6B
MHFVANYEIGSDISVTSDDEILEISCPRGEFRARIKNIPRSVFTVPFLLSLHLYFEDEDLEDAKSASEDLMVVCLNMLALATGAGLRRHRIRQIVVTDEPGADGMRDVLMWADKVEYSDPQPALTADHLTSIERLLEWEAPPAIERALRWYRLGVDASAPDDQFTYFWFALEIVAEYQKPTARVNDRCPHCQSALYCETCEKHPVHRPYAKQAIHALMRMTDPDCTDETVAMLDDTRNRLMHGATLREIEASFAESDPHVVDVLGRLLWLALLKQFPRELTEEGLLVGVPSTYVRSNMTAVAHARTVVPADDFGNFDLDFKGFSVKFELPGPPQSASPTVLRMTHAQYDQLRAFSYRHGEHREMITRIANNAREIKDNVLVGVLATDMPLVREAVRSGSQGGWEELFREVLDQNGQGEAS